jgi:hypothetical protein
MIRYALNVSRRDEWRRVLDVEVRRWSALSAERLAGELRELQAYEVEFDSKTYQVEVQLLENTETYLNVDVAVDDGSLPASIRPESHNFIYRKTPPAV